MKEIYETPEMIVTMFDAMDVITTSAMEYTTVWLPRVNEASVDYNAWG